MLHKSFKPAKCKTALKLVVSRTKLLKNKKEVLVKQLRRDLAQLLQSGQDQTARIQVEHVIREEKMMAAYELIEIFCELIAIRLPIIESQKNCPIDLKEAVSSVIFATPRCSDIPELIDIRKHFTAKYGKEFVSAAIELRPDCGVNRTLVEKLSAKAPDGPTKLKILTAIAEEHDIKWDPISFGEKDSNSQEDLLNGPKALETASVTHVESSNVQAPYYDGVSPNVCISPENEAKQEAPINYRGNNDSLSFGSQTVTPTHANVSAAPTPNLKPSGNGIDRMESSNLYSEDQNPNFVHLQNWNMEFKDATSAAQAAAESAERASMAARAAAELSTRTKIMTQNSTGSQSFSAYASRNETPRRQLGSNFDSEAFARGQMSNNSLEERSSRQQNEEISAKGWRNLTGHAERPHGDGNKSNDRPSEIPSAASTSDSSKDNRPLSRPSEHWMGDESSQSFGGWNYQDQTSINEDEGEEEGVDLATLTERVRGGRRQSEIGSRPSNSKKTSEDTFSDKASYDTCRNSSQNLPHSDVVVSIDEFSMRRQSQKFEVEPSDGAQDVLRTEKASNLEDDSFRLIGASSYSHPSLSSSVSDRQEVVETNSRNLEDAVTGNSFANFDDEKYHEDAKTTNEGGSVVFDDYGSDCENYDFDLDKGPETSSHIFSPERKSTSYLSENINAASVERNRVDLFGNNISESHSPRERRSASIFSKSLDESAVQVKEDELPPVIFDDARGPHSESEEEPKNLERDPEGIFTSGSKRSQFNLIGKGSDKFDDPVSKKNQDQGRHSRVSLAHEADDDDKAAERSPTVDDSETPGKSRSDGATELSFGKLTGGLRNKGYRHPPYLKGSLREASSSIEEAAGEIKKSPISYPPTTWPSSEIADDPYDQEVNNEIQKQTSTTATYGGSLGEASAARKSSEDAAKKSPSSSATRKETIDSEIGAVHTLDKDGEYKRLSGRVEEKSLRILSGEVPLSKQAVGDPSVKYGLSNPPGQISRSHLELNSGMDSAAGNRSNSQDSFSSYDSEQSGDPKEEVLSQVSGSRARYGVGLSRRTKGNSSKTDRSSHLKSSLAPEEETREPLKFSTRSSYTDRRYDVKLASLSKEGETQEIGANTESSLRNSYDTGAYRSTPSESAALDDGGSSDRLQLGKEGVEKPKSEPVRVPKLDSSGPNQSSKAAKPNLEDTSSESSFNRASHVHPKLPDFDSIAAQLELLRGNRK